MDQVDTYLSINQTCERFGLSRSTFYRMLRDYPRLEEDHIVIRVPPVTGPRRIRSHGFEEWLRDQADPHHQP